jgi:hypothetical protein
MNMASVCKIFGVTTDERFMEHRRRSTSMAGIISCLLAVGIFEYRNIHDHIWSWDVLSVALAFAVIKLSMMAWYRFTD